MPRKVFSLSHLVALAASSVALLLLHVLARTPVPAYARVLGALPGVAALILWWHYFRKEELDRFPFLEYAVTQFYVSWAMPSVTLRSLDLPVVSDRSLAWAVLGGCVVTATALLAYPIGKSLGLPLVPYPELESSGVDDAAIRP